MELEIRARDGRARRVAVAGRMVVGRENSDLVLDDPAVSRRHVLLSADGALEDLGSQFGTWVNGTRVHTARLNPGDRVVVGDTVLTVLGAPSGPDAVVAGRVAVTYRPGSHGERAAAGVTAKANRVWPVLASLVRADIRPTIRLCDPFADPANPDRAVVEGSVIDHATATIHTVVTSEAPADDPGRTLALLIAPFLGPDREPLLEGYGLHLSGVGDTDDLVRTLGVTAPSTAGADRRAAAAVSFVRYLLARDSEQRLRDVLTAERLDAALQATYGRGLAALEHAWATKIAGSGTKVPVGQFLRMSLRQLRPYARRQAEIVVYMVLSLAFMASFPYVSRRLFDTAIPSGDFGQVVNLLAVLAVAFVVSLLAGVRQAYVATNLSGSVVRDMRASMFGRLQRLPLTWFDRYPQGEVISRLFSDVRVVESGLSQTLTQGAYQALTLLVSGVILLTIHPLLGVIVLAVAPVIALIYRGMSTGAQSRSIRLQEESSGLLGVAAENHAAQPVVKLFSLRPREEQRFAAAAERVLRAESRLGVFGGFFSLSVNMVATLLRLLVFGLGAWLVLDGRFTVGGLVAFLAVMGDALAPVTALTALGQAVQRATGAMIRINEVLGAPTEDDDPSKPPLPRLAHEIRLHDVSYSYASERPALCGVSCVIPAGARVAFVGPSGSGKSTVLRLLMRIDDPTEGAITFDGVDLRAGPVDSLRAQLGVVFQDPFLFDTTIAENVALGRLGATEDEVLAAARAAEVDQFVATLPRGYDTLVGERGSRLSGGQRQRVSIARALVREPAVLLLDEATSALDAHTERQILRTLDRLSRGRTTIAVTHRLTAVVSYDQIFVLSGGRLVEQGTHGQLLAAGGAYARLWAEQTGLVFDETFDPLPSLARLPLFGALDEDGRHAVARALVAVTLPAGAELHESDGALCLLAHGQAQVLGPQVVADLGPGDVFGYAAILGTEHGRRLRAVTEVRVLRLDATALSALAARFPALAVGRLDTAPTRGDLRPLATGIHTLEERA